MDKDFIASYLKTKNYWWLTKRVEKADIGTPRTAYLERLLGMLGEERGRAIALSGMRRSGKTTIMFQAIDSLLHGVEANRLIYFKMDDLVDKTGDIREVIGVYTELSGVDPIRDRAVFFIDEIHFMKNWQLQLKHYIDSHARSAFVISSSSKSLLYKDASESLAGRIRFINVFPLTFLEFAAFSGMDGIPLPVGNVLDYEAIKKAYYELLPKKESLIYLLKQYMEVGGFPEWFKIRSSNQWQKLLEEYLALILFKDIVSVFKIKDPLLLEKLIREIAQLSTNRFSYLGISNRLDADRETIKLYLYYLKTAMLVMVADIYSRTRRMSERKEKKIYFMDEGMRKALTFDNKSEGASIENVAAWHMMKRGLDSKTFFVPFYWKNRHELDIVYDDSRQVIPIEVKYASDVKETDFAGLLEFMEKFEIDKGAVVTKDIFESRKLENGKIVFLIPAWLFLLLAS